ncbi:MAG: Holliday junction resolvase RuvX [Saprospiraceae bacterium]|nr:Holliday junction resolvase RuvX [Saprospiraceae bacterium]
MGRILGIDYGAKRCGIAVTDPLQIIVNGLTTVDSKLLREFILDYHQKEQLDKIVIGISFHKDNTPTSIREEIDGFVKWIQESMEGIDVDFVDERNTSVSARKAILDAGIGKNKRKEKALLDKVSAVLILQRYLGHF